MRAAGLREPKSQRIKNSPTVTLTILARNLGLLGPPIDSSQEWSFVEARASPTIDWQMPCLIMLGATRRMAKTLVFVAHFHRLILPQRKWYMRAALAASW